MAPTYLHCRYKPATWPGEARDSQKAAGAGAAALRAAPAAFCLPSHLGWSHMPQVRVNPEQLLCSDLSTPSLGH